MKMTPTHTLLTALTLAVTSIIGRSSAFVFHPDSNRSIVRQRVVLFGGFGGGAGASSKKTKKDKKTSKQQQLPQLKPKQQWDRFSSVGLKSVPGIGVGVRLLDDSDDNEKWYSVGAVKSVDDNAHTVYAVLRQRALIADHAKRLYPLQIRNNCRVEWGYCKKSEDDSDEGEEDSSSGNNEWIAVSPKEMDSLEVPDGAEKAIAFEGFCDTATGFYCQYHQGKLVSESITASTSKYV